MTRITVTLHKYICAFMIISRRILFKLVSISENGCKENQNTRFIFNNFFRKSRHLWDDVEKYGRVGQATDENTTGCMRFPCWITKATNTHSEYLILFALPLQQRLRLRDSIWRYTYSASLVWCLIWWFVYCAWLVRRNFCALLLFTFHPSEFITSVLRVTFKNKYTFLKCKHNYST